MIYNINNSNSNNNNNKITVVLWYMHMANKPSSCAWPRNIYISIVTYDTQILTVINRGRYNIISFPNVWNIVLQNTIFWLKQPPHFSHPTQISVNSIVMKTIIFRAHMTVFFSNRLSLNPVKTKYIALRPRHMKQNISEYSIQIGNTVLSRIDNDCTEKSTKFLGMYLDENLTWKLHIHETNKKSIKNLILNKTTEEYYASGKPKNFIFCPCTPSLKLCYYSMGKYRQRHNQTDQHSSKTSNSYN